MLGAITKSVFAAMAMLTSYAPVVAQTLSGPAIVTDGDSLTVAGRKVRLLGIDAPELDQTCNSNGQTWQCGQVAKEQLGSLVTAQTVTCHGQGIDQYGRVLAVCTAGHNELNQAMVEEGWALAYRQYSETYVPAELRARAENRGIWASQFVKPSEYRQSKSSREPRRSEQRMERRATARPSPWTGGCTIKGNRNRRGEWIYHLPGMPYYDRTRPEEIFCTEAQAQAAGYRRAIVRP